MAVDLPTAPFGRTGHSSTRLIFGAAALGGMSQERADATLAAVAEWGINHIDTAASYGASEDRLRPWLSSHRGEVFLATKTGERRGDAARAELERSLQRMDVDHVDSIQLHNLVEPDEWEVAHGPDGAVSALAQARDEGLVRYIGVTGHGLRIAEMHLRSLDRFPFDSVLFPYNHSLLADPAYRADVEALVLRCEADGVAVQTIKSVARRRWSDDAPEPRYSWYEPLTEPDAIARAVRYVLADGRLFVITSSDARLLPHEVAAALGPLERPSDDELAADEQALGIEPIFDGGTLERI
jgi:aryl-alcohol dehydrogenase-like predicted oxidoreductase